MEETYMSLYDMFEDSSHNNTIIFLKDNDLIKLNKIRKDILKMENVLTVSTVLTGEIYE
jgi:hypothetical protein